jgi:hypothetical protein
MIYIIEHKTDTDLRDDILRAVTKKFDSEIDNTWDIPYIAGYNEDGSKIYIDRHLPRYCIYKNKRYDVYPFLVLHEKVEKGVEKETNEKYQYCHQIALRAEKAAVDASSLPWEVYNAFCNKYVKKCADERLIRVPKDLDLRPYEDEDDYKELERIVKAQDLYL